MSRRTPSVDDLERLADRYARRGDVPALSMGVVAPGMEWYRDADRPYFIASTTKLYTTAIVMQLRSEGTLDLDDRIGDHLAAGVVEGLNVQGTIDRSREITVRQLLSHTSGIADYFEQKAPGGSTLIEEILRSDRGWTFDEAIERAKRMPARFPPGAPDKAAYSDTNYQLLGAIIGARTGSTYDDALRGRILHPLDLDATWLFTTSTLDRYGEVAPMRYGSRDVRIPEAMASFGPDGGIVSTAREQITFLRAFVGGELFPSGYLEEMTSEWRRVFFPLEYGIGIMRFALPWYMSPGKPVAPMIGHSGASGAVLFHSPERSLFAAAGVNQIEKRSLAFRLLSRV